MRKIILVFFLFLFVPVFVFAQQQAQQIRRTSRRDAPLCPTQRREVKELIAPLKVRLDSLRNQTVNIALSFAPVFLVQKINPPLPPPPSSSKFFFSLAGGLAGEEKRVIENCEKKSSFRISSFFEGGVGMEVGKGGKILMIGGYYSSYPYGGLIASYKGIGGGIIYQRTENLETLYLLIEIEKNNFFLRVTSAPGVRPLFFIGARIRKEKK